MTFKMEGFEAIQQISMIWRKKNGFCQTPQNKLVSLPNKLGSTLFDLFLNQLVIYGNCDIVLFIMETVPLPKCLMNNYGKYNATRQQLMPSQLKRSHLYVEHDFNPLQSMFNYQLGFTDK